MNLKYFSSLEVVKQEELIEKYGLFIRTIATGRYLCDVYYFDNFYVVFYYLIDETKNIQSKCFYTSDHIQPFIDSITGTS